MRHALSIHLSLPSPTQNVHPGVQALEALMRQLPLLDLHSYDLRRAARCFRSGRQTLLSSDGADGDRQYKSIYPTSHRTPRTMFAMKAVY